MSNFKSPFAIAACRAVHAARGFPDASRAILSGISHRERTNTGQEETKTSHTAARRSVAERGNHVLARYLPALIRTLVRSLSGDRRQAKQPSTAAFRVLKFAHAKFLLAEKFFVRLVEQRPQHEHWG